MRSRLVASLFILVTIVPCASYAQTQALRLGCGEFKEEVPRNILSIIQKEEDDAGSLKNITEKNFLDIFSECPIPASIWRECFMKTNSARWSYVISRLSSKSTQQAKQRFAWTREGVSSLGQQEI